MTKLRVVPLVTLFSLICLAPAQTDDRTIAADIVFLVDASWSIGQENFQYVREFLFRVIKAFDIGENRFRFGLVQYSEKPQPEFNLNTYFAKQDILFHVWNMSYKGGGTKTGLALEYLIKEQLTKANGSRADQGVPQIIIVLTDGRSQDDVIPASASLKSTHALIFAIGVQQAVEWELMEIASAPHERFVYRLDNFAALEGIVNDLVASVHMAAAHLLSDGIIKDTTAQESADLIFLIDGSASVGSVNFQYIRDFIVNFIENLEIGLDRIQIGVVQYSDEPNTEFYLNSYSTKTEVLDAVKRLQPKGGDEINTGAAVQFLVDNVFNESAGSRASEGVPQAVVIITSSEASDDINQAELLLKQGSIFTFCIGGRDADINELTQLSTDASFTALISEFRDIAQLQPQFLPLVSAVARREIILEPLVINEVPDRRRDIVFLMDGSSSVGNQNFLKMREFVLKITNKFQIGPNAVQVAVVQYSNTQKTEFLLNAKTNKNSLQLSIKKLRMRGGTERNIGAALEYVLNEHFTASAGSRREQNIPQFLVLVTSGASTDSIRSAALELKKNAIMTFAVGVGHADPAELREIAFSPSLVVEATDFRNLLLKPKTLITKLSKLTTPTVITEEPTVTITEVVTQVVNQRDIVFLIDGSINVGNVYFPVLRNFIRSIIEILNIGRNSVQVAVVQYSNDAKAAFYLNSYSTKSDVVAHVNGLKLKGGRILNTGMALDYVHKNVFTKSTGSRIEDGVPQILLVVTAGRSNDDVRPYAEALAREDILVIAIGVGEAEEEEVKRIAFNHHTAFQLNNFNNLIDIRDTVSSSVRTLVHGGITVTLTALKKDIVFLIDGSAGMGQSFLQVREFLIQVVQQLEIGPNNDKICMVRYSSDPRVEFGLDTYLTKEEILEAIRRLSPTTGRPLNTGLALDFVAKNVFTPSAGGRRDPGVSQILVLITAGKSRDDVGPAAGRVKLAGIVPIAIGAKSADTSELQKIVFDPAFILTMRDFQDLSVIQQELLSKMRTVVTFEEVDAVKRDVVFLIDGSENVRPAFSSIKNFITRVIDNLDIGSDKVQIGLVQYSENPNVNFFLNSYSTKRDMLDVVRFLRQQGGQSVNTGKALEYVKQNIFTKSAGSRVEEGVPQFLILLTASKSADDVGQAALALKQAGVAPFIISSGGADRDELQQISLSPDYIFEVPDLQNVEILEQRLASPLTTLNKDQIVQIHITTTKEAVKRDVVFLVDGSENARPAFPAIKKFITRVVDNLDVGRDKVQVGLVQYSEDPSVNFYLNSYTTIRDLTDVVNNLRQLGGRSANTGKALEYVKQNMFTRPAGSRVEEGVPQFLILLTASRSADDVGQAALALKQAGVAPFTIGSGNVDEDELRQISLSPKYIFKVPDLRNVETVQQQLGTPLTTLNKDQIVQIHTTILGDTIKRDVVFLIDGSENVRPAFPAIKKFITRVVDNLDVGRDKVQVGLVQYSEDPRVNFYLNSYTTKKDLTDMVNNLRQLGGRSANTGKALEYVKQNMFTRPAGSRVEEGVPQFLILLTASRSADDVGQAALALKQAGVAPFTIGSGNVEEDELRQISLSPKYIFKVPDLRNVETVQQHLGTPLTTLNKDQIVQIHTTILGDSIKRDVVFLVDGSENARVNFPSIKNFINTVVDDLDIESDKVRVSIAQFSEDPRVNFFLNTYTTKDDVKRAVNDLRYKGGRQANIGEALSYVTKNVFTPPAGSRLKEGVPQFLILLTASRSSDDVSRAALGLKQAGVAPISIGSGDTEEDELQQISMSPKFSFKVDDLQNLETLTQRLKTPLKTLSKEQIIKIIQDAPEAPSPIPQMPRRDVVFLVDGSDQAQTTFPQLKTFMIRVAENLDIGRDRIRLAVVQYSDNPSPEFLLNTYTNKPDVVKAIRNVRPKRGKESNIGRALEYVRRSVFTRASGSRKDEDVPQFLILLTAGRSSDDVRQRAESLKREGIAPFAIGTRNADTTELQHISLSPDYVFKFSDLQNAQNIKEFLIDPMNDLENDRIFEIRRLQDVDKRDIVFLFDGSVNARSTFPSVRSFLSRIVNNLDVGIDKIRVGVVQYSDNPRVEFLLNDYTTKSDVQSAIQNLRHKGGRSLRTGEALNYVRNNVFTKAGGSRIAEGVPQFLVLLTAGKSTDSVDRASLALKQGNVAPFVIGYREADDEELRQISLSPDYTFKIADMRNTQRLQQNLLRSLTALNAENIREIYQQNLVEESSSVGKKDIVFLIDGSNNVGHEDFVHIRDFILKIINNLDIGANKVQVGLAQYSNDMKTEFLLKEHTSKSTLQNAIRRIRPKGGTLLNTGMGLDFVMKNHFIRQAGSRRHEGVPQYLIVINSGNSRDNAQRYLGPIRNAGINVFGIGAKNVSKVELQKITTVDYGTYVVREFRDLKNVQESLKNRLQMEDPKTFATPEPPTEVLPQNKADIVFILDGSINIGRQNFPRLTEFVANIADATSIDDGLIQVGVVQYNSDATNEFFLNSFQLRKDVLEAIRNIEYKGGRALNTGSAFRFVKNNQFIKSRGSRMEEGVPQIVFLITGGKSDDDAIAAARELKNAQFKIITVGVENADVHEISQVASAPAVVFRKADMNKLSDLTEHVLTAMMDISGELCPIIPETIRDCDIDVVFGFDAQTNDIFSSEPGFRSKLGSIFYSVSQLQPITCTGSQSPTVRIGLTVYGQDGQQRSLDLMAYQPEIMSEINRLASAGPYVFGTRTLDAYQNTFQSASANQVKVIIHFTDGTDEDFASLKRKSESLRREGKVHALILVSLEKVTGSADFSLLEFGRGFKYRRLLSINQHDIQHELGEEINNIAERVCCNVPCKCGGQPGDKGPQGPRGQKGSPGPKGIIGHPGDEGGAGERGPPGINGTQGFHGCPGQSGFKGARGYPGEKGQTGELGLDGINGEQGAQGIVGKSGERGSPGEWGTKGTKGSKGERGELGYRGDPGEPGTTNNQRGPKGQRGDMGLVGDPGSDGRPGPRGQNGKRGSQGRRGPPGSRGTKGNPGTLGPPGVSGFRGPQGEAGPPGIPGREGVPGIRGPRGPIGPTAPSGARGKIGLNGRKGEPGNPGEKGEFGPTGPRGEMGEDGANGIGDTGVKGRKGERGPLGPLGFKGNFGIKGEPGRKGMKGNRGRRGFPGVAGEHGPNGEMGYPGPQGAKGVRGRSMEKCSLVRQIKDTCPCCYGTNECPVYPTELAFVIDTSNSKNANQLIRNKNAILNIVRNLTIVESNCPKGARVAILTYSNDIVTEIRFSGARNKRDLLTQIENLQFVPSRKASNITNAMSFVARNTFKRVRSGFLTRKVAVFFIDGQTKPKNLNNGIMKLASENIISVYLSPEENDAFKKMLQRNDAGISQFFVFRNDEQTLSKVMACHICLDFCEVNTVCDSKVFRGKRSVTPTDVDLDIAFIVDSSATINPTQFIEIKRYISFMTEQLEISREPDTSNRQARIAMVQHALYDSQTNDSLGRVKIEFSLTDYRTSQDIREHIQHKVIQLEGVRATAEAVKWTIRNIFEKAPQPRPYKLIALMTAGDLPEAEKKQLELVVTDAKCKGFFFVIFHIFKKPNEQDLINLASNPQDVYFKPISKISELHNEDFLRFAQQLPKYISAENAFHLSPELEKQCGQLQSDQPSSEMFGNIQQQVTSDVPVAADKLVGLELSAYNVTEDSIILHLARTEAQHIDNYEVTVVEVSQNMLVLKLNISDPEIVIKDLENGQRYNIIVIGFSQSKAKSIYSGVFTTKKSREAEVKSSITQVIVEPIENPEIDRCMLDFDAGSQCSEYTAKWFFDSKNNICTQFWYGGCDGNGNRFDTEAECNAECIQSASISEPKLEEMLSAKDICQLPRNEGTCRNFSLKWYYDAKTEKCARFWYGGCNGNENRFNTQDECSKICVQGRVQTRMITTVGT
ncbi:collagen alpha-3(VI) chain-like isoform X2 [Narcine bancroftii]|uniref:collagen alpha-3(VI) chain-like isoform X2 n=1 Tax=Narcine bancroftii TaxID=1343680 RepID=UPI0038311E3A